MNPFTARLLAYLCLGLALALGVPPWFQPDSKREYVTEAGVFLSSLALSREGLSQVCPDDIAVLDSRAMNAYPGMSQALRALESTGGDHGRVFFESGEARALAASQGRPDAERLCISFDGGTYLLRIRSRYTSSKSYLVQVGAVPRQTSAAKSLSPGDLERYPFLKAYVEGLAGSPYYREVRSPAPIQYWSPFLDSLGSTSGQGSVKTSAYLIRISVRDFSEWVTTQLVLLSWIRKISGAVLFILGLWILGKAYAPGRGIEINPRWAVVFGDVVFVLCLGVLTAGPFDYAFEQWFGLLPLMDEPLQATLSLMYLPCLFFLAWMAANLGGQSLEVDSTGVAWHGPTGGRFLAWDHILGLDLRDSHVMVSRVGLPMSRRLQTMLVFKLAGGLEQEMFEPGTNHRKQTILAALTEYAPNRLRGDLERISQEW